MADFRQKYIQYFPDGSGRDSYINSNSGGFSKCIPKQAIPNYKVSSFFSSSDLAKIRDLSKSSWTFQYKSDGSGRDSYILSGSGGLQNEYRSPKPFKEALRCGASSYLFNNLNSSNKNKIRYLSKDEYVRWKKLSKVQENVINRLYTNRSVVKPKKDKFEKYTNDTIGKIPSIHRPSYSIDYAGSNSINTERELNNVKSHCYLKDTIPQVSTCKTISVDYNTQSASNLNTIQPYSSGILRKRDKEDKAKLKIVKLIKLDKYKGKSENYNQKVDSLEIRN